MTETPPLKPNCELIGSLIVYNSSDRKDITKINHFLFGRVVSIKKDQRVNKYYYPGALENQPFKKITNGCYFTKRLDDNCGGLLNILPAKVSFFSNDMVTARKCWEGRIKGKVNNW